MHIYLTPAAPKPKHPFVQAFEALSVPANVSAVTRLRGTVEAKLLLLAEHPTEDDYAANAPFINDGAKVFTYLMQQAGLEVDDNFIVMPYSRFGPKANKASTVHTLPFLKEHLDSTNVKCVVCVGMGAFGYTFAGGRKTHSRSIIGNPMYLPSIGVRPVYVLPDTSLLLDTDSRDFRLARRAGEKAQQVLNLTLNLKAFLAKKLQLHYEN